MTDTQDALWELEKRFWLDGADFYEARLADGAVMVLPYPALLMERDRAIEAISQGPRWTQVEFSQTGLQQRGRAAVLSYRATAWREGDEAPYHAICASTYVDDPGDGWLMMSHSQQPDGPGA